MTRVFGIVLAFLPSILDALGAGVYNSLAGKHLKVAVAEQNGGNVFIRSANGTFLGVKGVPVELLSWLAARLNFTYSLVPTFMRLDPLANGTWVGAYGLIHNKKVDLAAAYFAIAAGGFSIADFTATLRDEPIAMLVPLPAEQSRILATWIFLVVTAVSLVVLLYGILKLENKIALVPGHGPSMSSLILCNLQLLLGQGGFAGPLFGSLCSRLALLGWILGVVVFVNSYTGSYISAATIPKLIPVAETTEDVAHKTDLLPIVPQYALVSSYVTAQGGTQTNRILGERVVQNPKKTIFPDASDFIDRVATGCCVYFCPRALLELYLYRDLEKTGQCRGSIPKADMAWDFYVFVTQKGSPYTSALSTEILHAKELGLAAYWFSQVVKRPFECLQPPESKIRPLTLKDLSSAFVILLVGLTLSISVFGIEAMSAKMSHKN